MKYIRTKDGRIFEIEKDLGKYGKSKAVIICDFNGNFIDVEKRNMILKQADTIEELCDEFVVENPEGDIHERCVDLQDVFDWVGEQEIPIGIKDFDEERNLISGEHDWNVYGGIWTKKGLIYVAKMNNEGVLELL